ncbi:MAG: tetratricopeptide repeat protein [Bacteroidales bacterium]|nr:tetratricopeptide repeat protein [Bacteroidales bacterium]
MKKIILILIIQSIIFFCLVLVVQGKISRENENITYVSVSYTKEDTVKIFLDSAQYLREQGKIEDAINIYRKVTVMQPDNAEAYIGWLTTCFGSDRVDEGLRAIDQWVELNPDNTQACLYKAFAEAELGNHQKSLEAFEKLIELQPDEATNWIGKGQMLYALNRYDEALEAFNKYTLIDTTRTDVWGMKASTLARLGRFDEAINIINKNLEQSPDDPTSIYNRACIYSIKGDKAIALADLKSAIELEASFRKYARTDEDFRSLYEDEDFKNLTK